jgi:KEOPS complex subunit Cgi121
LEEGEAMRINGFKKFAIILGFRDVKIDDSGELLKEIRRDMSPTTVQLFDADHVAGKPHLFFAALNALKAFEKGRNISEKLEMETLLYASGQRQIDKAIEMLGVRPESSKIALLMIASNEEEAAEAEKIVLGIRDDKVLEIEGEGKVRDLMEAFGVTRLELETMVESDEERERVLMWLIIERNALLAIEH